MSAARKLPWKAQPGDRVRLLSTNDSFTLLVPGAEGVVDHIDDTGTVHVDWDDGERLGLIWDSDDRWEVIS